MNPPSQDQALPRLVVDSPDRIRGQVHVLDFEPLLVGRDSTCQIQLLHPQISRRHALVWWADGHTTVEDLASTNGTRLNGHLVRGRQTLHSGDVLDFGPLEVHYEEPSEEAVTAVAEPEAGVPAQEARTAVTGGDPPSPRYEDAAPPEPTAARPASARGATAREEAAQEEAAQEETTREEAQEEAAQEDTVPRETVPDGTTEETPGTAPEDSGLRVAAARMAARPADAWPTDPRLADPRPASARPTDSRPASAWPADPRPAEREGTPQWGSPAHAVPPRPPGPPPGFGPAPERTRAPQPDGSPPGTPPSGTPALGTERRFDVAEQRAAGNLSNIGGNQYNNYVQQNDGILLARRKAYFRKLRTTRNTARRVALVGLLLAVLGFAFRAWLNSEQDVLNRRAGGAPIDTIGLAVGITGTALLVLGCVLVATTVFRQRRYEQEEERRLHPDRSPSR